MHAPVALSTASTPPADAAPASSHSQTDAARAAQAHGSTRQPGGPRPPATVLRSAQAPTQGRLARILSRPSLRAAANLRTENPDESHRRANAVPDPAAAPNPEAAEKNKALARARKIVQTIRKVKSRVLGESDSDGVTASPASSLHGEEMERDASRSKQPDTSSVAQSNEERTRDELGKLEELYSDLTRYLRRFVRPEFFPLALTATAMGINTAASEAEKAAVLKKSCSAISAFIKERLAPHAMTSSEKELLDRVDKVSAAPGRPTV